MSLNDEKLEPFYKTVKNFADFFFQKIFVFETPRSQTSNRNDENDQNTNLVKCLFVCNFEAIYKLIRFWLKLTF